jgi:hypothetical protein
MSETPLDDKLAAALRSSDPFTVAIRGHTHLDEVITQAIDASFGGAPREIRRLNFRTKLALAIALELLPQEYEPFLGALTQLRNDFAHGNIEVLEADRASRLVDTAQRLIGEVDDAVIGPVRGATPLGQLRFALMVAVVFSVGSIKRAHELRAQQIAALEREKRSPLILAALAKAREGLEAHVQTESAKPRSTGSE